MKQIILALLFTVVSTAQPAEHTLFASTSKDMFQPRILNGLFMTGSTVTVHEDNQRYTTLNFEMFDHGEFVGTISRLDDATLWKIIGVQNPGPLWASASREEIIHFGRGSDKRTLLFSGIEGAPPTMVSGQLVYDDTTNTYSGKDIVFEYDLPSGHVKEAMSGFIRNVSGDSAAFEMLWVFHDLSVDSTDTIFTQKLVGRFKYVIEAKPTVPLVFKTVTNYQFFGGSLSSIQAINFVKWFTTCVMPLRHE